MEPWYDLKTAILLFAVIDISLFSTVFITIFSIKNGFKKLVYTIIILSLAVSIVSFITGTCALMSKQPFYVWLLLLLPGVGYSLSFSRILLLTPKRFTEYELRKMQAKDL